ncbi:hypothetical protein PGT21_015467 [Puccinia graminis f. sp. tritici]|uniref:Uncharacterized protein n=1 Tax=Puccinia graminis f. sp. tritici TaxID=56615 RepID=A0A5B0QXH5_PUCGR|nr:hypothetical protein PGT21_015467 [Puccinia graminis f. sp. tritici]
MEDAATEHGLTHMPTAVAARLALGLGYRSLGVRAERGRDSSQSILLFPSSNLFSSPAPYQSHPSLCPRNSPSEPLGHLNLPTTDQPPIFLPFWKKKIFPNSHKPFSTIYHQTLHTLLLKSRS